MKKIIIGSLVGGILIFIWQTLSWTAFNLHDAAQAYTPKQDSIMNFLNSQFSEDGSYHLARLPNTASGEEMQKHMDVIKGKPWAQVQYHKAFDVNMGVNIAKGLIADIITVAFLCWILMRIASSNPGTIFTACLFVGVIVFINSPYTQHIWYPKADIMAHFIDALVSWALCGVWLGWYLTRKIVR
jgi:F0F1-type ATP synthase assembly protein I